MMSPQDRALLLEIARDAIDAHVTGGRRRATPSDEVALRPGGAFVTIRRLGELRGCIGHIEPDRPLALVVADCAVSAASRDPRFPPLSPAELNEIDIELSLLGPLEPIAGPDAIALGVHGVVVEHVGRRGLLLPQVAVEWKWDAVTFLAQTCRKAGLAVNAWKHGASIWRFEAEVFGELLT